MNDNEELKKIDTIRERMHCGYDDAKRSLDAAEGSITGALALLDRERKSENEDLLRLAGELVAELEAIGREGAVKKVRIKFGDRTIKELPLVATAGAAVLLTLLAILISQTSIEVERESEPESVGTDSKCTPEA